MPAAPSAIKSLEGSMKGSKRARDSPSDESRPESDGENESQCDNKMRRSGRAAAPVERYTPTDTTSKRGSKQRKTARFHITPFNEWQWLVKKMNVCVRNTLGWRSGEPLPRPTAPCWLLPCKDDTAVEISKHQEGLRALGWKLLTPAEPHVVSRIGQKANLHAYAKELGMLEHLPQHYESPETASYPCMLKAAAGEHGNDIFIVDSEEEVHEKAEGGFDCGRWLLQELCAGRHEYATSLLVKDGEILDAITTSYLYDKEIYVWPDVEEVRAFTAGTHSSCSRHNSPLTKCARRSPLPP